MKKIVLFAAAAMAVSSALAVAPAKKAAAVADLGVTPSQRVSAVSEMPKLTHTNSVMKQQSTSISKLAAQQSINAVAPTADDDAMSVLYAPSMGSFYLGWSPNFMGYNVTYGFTGIRNMIGFGNLSSGIDKSQWNYGFFVGQDADKKPIYDERTSDSANLYVELKPETFFTTPVLTATSASGKTEEYTAPIAAYFCGLSAQAWLGDDSGSEGEEGEGGAEGAEGAENAAEETETDILGSCLFSYISKGPDLVPEFYKNLKPTADQKDMFEADGTSVNWSQYLKEEYPSINFTSVSMTGVGSLIADRPSPYLMRSMWSYFQIECEDEVTLTSHVYYVTDEGIDYSKPIGEAVISLEAGTYPTKEAWKMQIFNYYSLDEDGYETDEPVAIDAFQPVFVTVEGVDNPNITRFAMYSTDTSIFTRNQASMMYYLFPPHALAILDVKYTMGTSTEEQQMIYEDLCPNLYLGDELGTSLYYPSDFLMFFDTSFPTVINMDKDSKDYDTANFSVEIPVDGGSAEFSAFVSYPVEGLIQDELMSVEASDWLTYDVSTDEETYVTTINVTGAAMPSDIKGRRGVVSFKGYACDFNLYVTQGEVSGISNVAATTGKVELFDLQGRKLNAVPANGIYLERNGNVTTKRIARN